MVRKKPDPHITDREFYIRSFTWGLPVNLGGAVVAAALLLTGHKPNKFGKCINFTVGKNWGGGSMGIFMITCKDSSRRLKEHEHGHSIQNCFYGPFMPFVNIQSSTRFLYRIAAQKLFPGIKLPSYDSVWFEREATELGQKFMRERT